MKVSVTPLELYTLEGCYLCAPLSRNEKLKNDLEDKENEAKKWKKKYEDLVVKTRGIGIVKVRHLILVFCNVRNVDLTCVVTLV